MWWVFTPVFPVLACHGILCDIPFSHSNSTNLSPSVLVCLCVAGRRRHDHPLYTTMSLTMSLTTHACSVFSLNKTYLKRQLRYLFCVLSVFSMFTYREFHTPNNNVVTCVCAYCAMMQWAYMLYVEEACSINKCSQRKELASKMSLNRARGLYCVYLQ